MRRQYAQSTQPGPGPGPYTELAWLQSSGSASSISGQAINTNLSPRYLKTEVKFREGGAAERTNRLQLVCGCWNSNNNRYYVAQHGNTDVSIMSSNKNNSIVTLASHNTSVDHVVIYNDESNRVLCDGVVKGSAIYDITVADSSLPHKVWLFGAGNPDSSWGCIPSSWRIYYAKFWDKQTGNLVRDFIPVLDTNNVACMYDKVTEQFFYNQGTGTFTYGTL